MVSMKDVARRTGLSRCTVSNILNAKLDGKSYRPETIALVRRTAAEMGYIANNIAKSLKTGATGTIAIIVPDIANSFYIKIIKEVERLAGEADYGLMICIAEETLENEEQALVMLQSRCVDGVMISPVSYEESLPRRYPFPVVCFDRTVKSGRYPTVLVDNEAGARKLTRELLKAAPLPPLFIGQSRRDFTVAGRLAGYKQALAEGGVRFASKNVIYDIYDNASALKVVNEVLKRRRRSFDSIFLSSNYYVYGVLQALADNGARVAALGGFEHFIGEALLGRNMTIVDQREADIGRAAFAALMALLRRESPAHTVIRTQIVKL